MKDTEKKLLSQSDTQRNGILHTMTMEGLEDVKADRYMTSEEMQKSMANCIANRKGDKKLK
ncbi:hypothetical protein NB640_01410 [Oxalobacter vibrioformis]|uniref:Uncharacterized protein n=1 Tax=Oxalobacter vibrioformis TaxID=933080 RepID=A0A9E9P4Q0_9BURK|nr:hypothetical protein [Oxalobacter vibrioformis]WAW10351.1 hypothetical protein NB640_01410 [Oxalobacter vibrioformis]